MPPVFVLMEIQQNVQCCFFGPKAPAAVWSHSIYWPNLYAIFRLVSFKEVILQGVMSFYESAVA